MAARLQHPPLHSALSTDVLSARAEHHLTGVLQGPSGLIKAHYGQGHPMGALAECTCDSQRRHSVA
eukprot:7622436-Alexandrium_andersonii.AAC.1